MGNRIAFVFITLPVHVRDPLARLEAIRAETAAFKGTGRAAGGEALLQGLGLLPLALQAPIARLAASPRMYNLVISNVPGPRMPVYLLGAECVEVLPAIPLTDGHALSVGVFSLRDRLCFGAYADPEALPQASELPGAIGAADELHPRERRLPPAATGCLTSRSPSAAVAATAAAPAQPQPNPAAAAGATSSASPSARAELRGGVEQRRTRGPAAGLARAGRRRGDRGDAEAAAHQAEHGEQPGAGSAPAATSQAAAAAMAVSPPAIAARSPARAVMRGARERARDDGEVQRREQEAGLGRREAAFALDLEHAQEHRRGGGAGDRERARTWRARDRVRAGAPAGSSGAGRGARSPRTARAGQGRRRAARAWRPRRGPRPRRG